MKKLLVMKKRSAIALTLALTFALSGLSAAKVYGAKAIKFDEDASITVGLAAEYQELAQNELNITFYQVASVNEMGEYEGVEALDGAFDASKINSNTTASTWKEMADTLASKEKLADCYQVSKTIQVDFDAPDGAGATVSIDKEHFGMYLMVANPVETEKYAYHFSPALIAVPGNNYYTYNEDGTPVENEEANDAWIYAVSAVLKPEFEDLYGNLVINKTLDTFNTSLNGTSFVYKVTAYKDYSDVDASLNGDSARGKLVYSNVVTIDFSQAGTQQALIEHIPAGAMVTVEEVYTGATYEATSPATAEAQIVKGAAASVDFSNTYDDTLTGNGTAVVNRFTYTPNNEEMTGSWSWTSQNQQ